MTTQPPETSRTPNVPLSSLRCVTIGAEGRALEHLMSIDAPLTDEQFRRAAHAHLEGAVAPDELEMLDADPVRWKAALVRLTGLAQAQISAINPKVKRINAEATEVRMRAEELRRAELPPKPPRAPWTPPPRSPQVVEVVYVNRGSR